MDYLHHKNRLFGHILSSPIIWSVLIPVVLADIWIELYHRTCFPLYGLAYIKRRHYIQIDRHKLSYLSLLQKISCMYCGYVNGVFRYWVAIAAQTEAYWCGIMHRQTDAFHVPEHHKEFLPYGDKEAFEKKFK